MTLHMPVGIKKNKNGWLLFLVVVFFFPHTTRTQKIVRSYARKYNDAKKKRTKRRFQNTQEIIKITHDDKSIPFEVCVCVIQKTRHKKKFSSPLTPFYVKKKWEYWRFFGQIAKTAFLSIYHALAQKNDLSL